MTSDFTTQTGGRLQLPPPPSAPLVQRVSSALAGRIALHSMVVGDAHRGGLRDHARLKSLPAALALRLPSLQDARTK